RMASEPFQIDYAEESLSDVKALRRFDQKKFLEGIETHLLHEPTKISRSRIRAMDQPFWSQYRLRVDEFRVYYDVDSEQRRVIILRVLEKGRRETPRGRDDEAN